MMDRGLVEHLDEPAMNLFGILFTYIRDNDKVLLVPWLWDRAPVFLALAQKISQFYITYYIENICHCVATWSV